MSEVAEKCIRPCSGTYVYCIIDKDKRSWDLQPPESSGLTESIFCHALFFCSFFPLCLSLFGLIKQKQNNFYLSQVSHSLVSSYFSPHDRASHSMFPLAQKRNCSWMKKIHPTKSVWCLSTGSREVKSQLKAKLKSICKCNSKNTSRFSGFCWLCSDTNDQMTFMWHRWDTWLSRIQKQYWFWLFKLI